MTNLMSVAESINPELVQQIKEAYALIACSTMFVTFDKIEEIPDFNDLYEEVALRFVEEKIRLERRDIDGEIRELAIREGFNIERGFSIDQFGRCDESVVYHALISLGLTFRFNGVVVNTPMRGVW